MGYAEGYADGQANTGKIQYVYHTHTGSAADASGCYTSPIYHSHNNSCYSDCPGTIYSLNNTGTETQWRCPKCNWTGYRSNSSGTKYGDPCPTDVLSCSQSGTIVGYTLGCGKTEETLESAVIVFQ